MKGKGDVVSSCALRPTWLHYPLAHGATSERTTMDAYRLCRFRRHVFVFTVMLCGLTCISLYSLSFSCCTVVNLDEATILHSGSRIIIVEPNLHKQHHGRSKRDVDTESNVGRGHFRRKPLEEDLYENKQVNNEKDILKVKFVHQNKHLPQVSVDSAGDDVYVYEAGDETYEDREYETDDSDQVEYTHAHRKGYRTSHNNNGYRHNRGMLRTSQAGTKKLPQAIIIGVKKGGTRALLEFLRIHPDVRSPGPEPHFFDRHYDRGLEWYRRQMPPTLEGQITVEKTPSYFITKGVPQRICNMSRDIKLIVVVRDPVTRAISDYTQAASKRNDLESFEQKAFLDNATGMVDTSWGAIRIGVYAKHLDRWMQYFPLNQMHFVHGERLISDPAAEMARVQDFLGLKQVITDKHFYFNTTKGFPCLKKTEGSGRPHCLRKTKGRPHPEVDNKVIKRLRHFFRPFNQKFYQITGIDFEWE